MKNSVIVIVVLAILVLGFVFLNPTEKDTEQKLEGEGGAGGGIGGEEKQLSEIKPAEKKEEEQTAEQPVEKQDKVEGVKEFSITARQWSFSPAVIEVNKGDRVKLRIKSIDVTHGFTLNEFGIKETLSPGKKVEVEFVANMAGTFSFFCHIPCGSGHTGMRGRLVVR